MIMKPAVDEMFPEGAGPYVDLDEVGPELNRFRSVIVSEINVAKSTSNLSQTFALFKLKDFTVRKNNFLLPPCQ